MLCIFKLSTLKDKNRSIEYSENDEKKKACIEKQSVTNYERKGA